LSSDQCPKTNQVKSKSTTPKKSLFRRINEWLHLWLGLLSGIVVFVVCFTAAIWVLRDEIAYFTKPFNRIQPQEAPYISPSMLKTQAEKYLDSTLNGKSFAVEDITYREPGKTTTLTYSGGVEEEWLGDLHINPYTGEMVYDEVFKESNTLKFFIFIRAGHRFFWLPQQIGSTVVGTSCLIFLIILITGLIWWYPSKWTKSTRKKSFSVKWKAKWKRLNIDLHNVLGFYAMLFIFLLTFTGVYYSFQWFRNSYAYALGVDVEKTEKGSITNNTNDTISVVVNPVDKLWRRHYHQQSNGDFTISFPADSISSISVTRNPLPGKFYKRYTQHFNQKTLALMDAKGIRNLEFGQLTVGEKIVRMNFDLHVGSIGGLPTKILACIASLIGASLPITGFIIWYNRKWGKKKKKRKSTPSIKEVYAVENF